MLLFVRSTGGAYLTAVGIGGVGRSPNFKKILRQVFHGDRRRFPLHRAEEVSERHAGPNCTRPLP
jgi:hypothetical protein